MTPDTAKYPSWRVLGDVLFILVVVTVAITIAIAEWAQPIRDSIKKHAPDVLMHYFLEHHEPHVPKLPKLPKL